MTRAEQTENTSGANQNAPDRCRVVLIASGTKLAALDRQCPSFMSSLLGSSDVASLVLYADGLDESAFQKLAETIVPVAQDAGVAAIIDNATRTAARVGADGIQLGQDPDEMRETIDRFSPQMIVGASNVKSRHNALVLGELQPDYLMFGKPGSDIKQQPHPKNLELGSWWSHMIEIPCIVMGGSDLDTIPAVAETGAEFVGLSSAIFTGNDGQGIDTDGASVRLAKANTLLDNHAPRFENPDA